MTREYALTIGFVELLSERIRPERENADVSVEVLLPTVLRPHAEGKSSVEVEGATVREVLADLVAKYPGLSEQLPIGDELPRFLNVYLDDEDIRYLDKLDTAVADRAVIQVMPAVSGGC